MSNIDYDWSQLRWMDMTEGQRSIYMEFSAPVSENNIKRMPENQEFISHVYFTPTQDHIDAFSNWDESSENLSNEAIYIHNSLTDGQKNAIILWLSEIEDEEYEEIERGEEINDW